MGAYWFQVNDVRSVDRSEEPMSQANQILEMVIETLICDRCGRTLSEGYSTRDYGVDQETGYQDVENICNACDTIERDAEADSRYEDDLYEAADRAFTMAFEMGDD